MADESHSGVISISVLSGAMQINITRLIGDEIGEKWRHYNVEYGTLAAGYNITGNIHTSIHGLLSSFLLHLSCSHNKQNKT